jgi:hypothetical protein
LLKDSKGTQRKYIEPACLSTTGLLEFRGEDKIDKLFIGAGQDGLIYEVQSIDKVVSGLNIACRNGSTNLKIAVEKTGQMQDSDRMLITVKTSEIDDLLLGYYPENILQLNKVELVYIADENNLSDFLKKKGLYSKLDCEEQEEY